MNMQYFTVTQHRDGSVNVAEWVNGFPSDMEGGPVVFAHRKPKKSYVGKAFLAIIVLAMFASMMFITKVFINEIFLPNVWDELWLTFAGLYSGFIGFGLLVDKIEQKKEKKNNRRG